MGSELTNGGTRPGSTQGSHPSELEDSLLLQVAGVAGTESSQLAPPEIGSVVDDKYVLERPLGSGGMGFVFAARHLTTGRKVAIKWMQRRGDLSELRKRFVREARAAGRIRHPNVIDIFDVVSSERATYLVMELLEGESLRARLQGERMAPGQAVELAISMLEGLNAAHQQGVIHRDLKPENVFLCASGAPKLLDFGISVFSEKRPALESDLTRTGYFVGTPVYTALERLREKQPFDHRVDLYSVGVILYEALTGTLPFLGKTPSELTYQLAVHSPQPLRELRPELSLELEAVVLKALARDPNRRFPDAAAFLDALRSLEQERRAPAPKRRAARFAVAAALIAVGSYAAASAIGSRAATPAKVSILSSGLGKSLLSTRAVEQAAPEAARTLEAPSNHESDQKPANEPRPRSSPKPALPGASHSAPTSPKAAEAKPAPAKLTVIVFPYGDVWVDGRHVGSSPSTIALSAGAHVVSGGRISPEREARVELAAGESRQMILSWSNGSQTASKVAHESGRDDAEAVAREPHVQTEPSPQ